VEVRQLRYVILGAIVEKVSGEPYGDYLRKEVFPRADSPTRTTATWRRSSQAGSGYEQEDGHYVNADYLSMTLRMRPCARLDGHDLAR